MVSRLKINTWKSCQYGVGIDDFFLNDVEYFLTCKKDYLPFKFLGIFLEEIIEGYLFGNL